MMSPLDNRFVQRQLERLYAVEREIIRLYAETCYSSIQAAYGCRSSVTRVEQLTEAIQRAGRSLCAIKAELRRLGVPREQIVSLDDLQRLNLFEAQFRRHDAAFAGVEDIFGRRQLAAMLSDITGTDAPG